MSTLSRILLGREAATESELEAALATATPAQLLALKKADLDFQLALRVLSVEAEKVHASDRDSARRRQQAMEDWTPSILGALIILGFFGVLGAMLAHVLPEGRETEFSIMLGALATMTAAVVNYFFGSSAGSREKTRLIAPVQNYPAPSGLDARAAENARMGYGEASHDAL